MLKDASSGCGSPKLCHWVGLVGLLVKMDNEFQQMTVVSSSPSAGHEQKWLSHTLFQSPDLHEIKISRRLLCTRACSYNKAVDYFKNLFWSALAQPH
jgi:hypothetical protein